MLEKSLVSVCINAYNAEKYIMQTIESVINQTYKNLQIIVVDDCSTDNTLNIIKSINDDRIEYYQTSLNGHMSFACNEALKHVKGDYVAHLDADDLWTSDKIEKQVNFLEENSEYGACFTYAEIIDESSNIADQNFDLMRKIFILKNRSHAEMYRFLFDNSNRMCHCSAFIRTNIIKKVGNYDVSTLYLQDFDYWMRLLTISPIYIIPEKLTLVRRHSDNNSDMTKEKWVAHDNEFARVIYKSINLCPDDLFFKAFSDKLRFKGEHTHEEIELEKAFLLLEGTRVYNGNPVLGIYKFAELFKQEKYVKLAAEKFNFTTRDLYKIQTSYIYFDSQKCCDTAEVYYDYGDGYTESNKTMIKSSETLGSYDFSVKLPQNVKSIRIDPVNNAFCIMKNICIVANGQELSFNGNYISMDDKKETLFFFNRDPQIWVNIDAEIKELNVRFNIIVFNFKNIISNRFDDADNAIGVLEDKIVSYQEIINNQTEIIFEKESLIKEKQTTIEAQQDIIKNKEQVILNKDNVIANINDNYNALNAQYIDITNSFYWRITAIPRKITHKMKNIIARHRKLMLLFVFAKGFLRGGFKEGKRRVVNYKTFLENNQIKSPKNNRDLIKISAAQRKFEERYSFKKCPKISILVPLYNTPDNFLQEMIDSVREQTYKNWELCLADGSDEKHENVGKYCTTLAKKDKRIKYVKLTENKGISDNTNECLKIATGDYISLFDHDDLLHPSVLFEYVKEINDTGADFIYCDELTFTNENKEFNIVLKHHKPEFSPDTLRSYNYICHFSCFSRKLYEMVGGFNKEYDGSQDYDLILRLTEKAQKIVRIPKLLYFWRSHAASVASGSSAKPYVVNAAEKALAAHLERIGLKGTVKESYAPTTYKIDYEIIGNPKISIIIPNKDHIEDLEKCVNSILSLSTYKNYEIIIVENNSDEQRTFEYYEKLERKNDNIKVVFWKEKAFNYSAINNFGAKFASGEYILLLNNDIEVITPNWLEEMLMFAQRKDVGAVGAKLYFPDDTIQHAGVILGIGGVAGHSHKYFDKNEYGYVSRAVISQNLSACTAACLLIRKDVFDEVQGLDEGFAVAFNDIDLCMKIRKSKYLIVFTPYAEFYHYESKSRGQEDSPEKVARFNSEINRFMKKWSRELKAGDPYYNPNLTLKSEDFSVTASDEQ